MPNLFHVGLTVRDVEKSIRFYCDVVGMEESAPQEHASTQFDKLTSNPGARLKVVMLKGGGFHLQLIQYLAGGGETLRPHHNNIGSPHFSFFVPDVAAKYKEVQQRGDVEITSGLVINASKTLHSFYVNDPDGVPVEFLERI